MGEGFQLRASDIQQVLYEHIVANAFTDISVTCHLLLVSVNIYLLRFFGLFHSTLTTLLVMTTFSPPEQEPNPVKFSEILRPHFGEGWGGTILFATLGVTWSLRWRDLLDSGHSGHIPLQLIDTEDRETSLHTCTNLTGSGGSQGQGQGSEGKADIFSAIYHYLEGKMSKKYSYAIKQTFNLPFYFCPGTHTISSENPYSSFKTWLDMFLSIDFQDYFGDLSTLSSVFLLFLHWWSTTLCCSL